MTPHVGIDIRKIRDFGIGSYIRHLLGGLAAAPEDHFAFTLFGDKRDFDAVPRKKIFSRRILTRNKRSPFQGKLRDTHGLSLFHAPYYLFPDPGAVPRVLTVHDLIHLHPPGIPLGYRYVYSTGTRVFDRLKRSYHRLLAQERLIKSLRRAEQIIAVSATTADALVSEGISPKRITKIYNCIDPIFFNEVSDHDVAKACKQMNLVPGTYFIYSGNDLYHKNIPALLDAWFLLCEEDAACPGLVLVGPPRKRELMIHVKRRNPAAGVRVIDYRGADELVCLMKGSLGLVTATLAEGFGLPIAEAMAVQTPVFCSDLPVFREITGGYATFFNPLDPKDIAGAISRYLRHPEAALALVSEAARCARRYRRKMFIAGHKEVYRRVFERGFS